MFIMIEPPLILLNSTKSMILLLLSPPQVKAFFLKKNFLKLSASLIKFPMFDFSEVLRNGTNTIFFFFSCLLYYKKENKLNKIKICIFSNYLIFI